MLSKNEQRFGSNCIYVLGMLSGLQAMTNDINQVVQSMSQDIAAIVERGIGASRQ